MDKPAPDTSIADLAAQTAHRRAPSSPQAKQQERDFRNRVIAAILIVASGLICLWLLFA